MQHPHADFLVADLFQRLGDRLGRALHVSLDQHRQFRDVLVRLGLGHQLFQRRRRTGSRAFVLGGFLAVIRDLARLRLGFDDVQHVPGFRRAIETQHLDRNRGTGFVDALALVVDQRPHLAPLLADDKDVAAFQRAVLHQNRRHRTTADVEFRLDHRALRRTAGVGAQFQDFRL